MRKNCTRVKDLTGMAQICIDLKPRRTDCDVFVNYKMDLTNLAKYIEKRKKAGDNITLFHAFVMAIGKTFYNREKLNYFVQNRHMYKHNDVVVSFVAKVEFEDSAEEMMIMIPIKPDDTIDTISKLIYDKVHRVRRKEDEKKGANSIIDVVGKMPNIIRVPIVGILKWMDKKGILPASICEDNLYYSSIIVSNLGPLKFGAIYHNNTDFGECSSIATMGEMKDEEVLVDGKKEIRKLCEFGINFDERVADGYYMIKSCKLIEHILANPELLEQPAAKIIDLEYKTKSEK